jgi:hypothetical protein
MRMSLTQQILRTKPDPKFDALVKENNRLTAIALNYGGNYDGQYKPDTRTYYDGEPTKVVVKKKRRKYNKNRKIDWKKMVVNDVTHLLNIKKVIDELKSSHFKLWKN